MKRFGLIGKSLSHSFSPNYFAQKFAKENIQGVSYQAYPIDRIEELSRLLEAEKELIGLNVTIPYKEAVLPYIDHLDAEAEAIGAVNTIAIKRKEEQIELHGFNTDVIGFRQSLKPFLNILHERALILGSGGASKAIAYVFQQLGIPALIVSRNPSKDHEVSYEEIDGNYLKHHQLIVNCSPIGMYPKTDECPPLPYEHISDKHLLYDLVYNPEETLFLKEGKAKGAITLNGLSMLHLQAEASWQIWQSS